MMDHPVIAFGGLNSHRFGNALWVGFSGSD